MGFTACTRDDPFVKRVRELYGANVVRAPRAGINPLDIVARMGDRVEMRGDLAPIITGDQPLQLPPITSMPAAQLTGQHSSEVDAELGAELTSKFLSALGVPIPGGALNLEPWKGATGFTFEVRDVREKQVDINYLGRALEGRAVDKGSPAMAIYYGSNPAQMHIVTRTLTSPHIAIRATAAGGVGIELSVDGIKDLLGKAKGTIHWHIESRSVVAFRGARAVTFALAAVPCNLRDDGTFTLGLEVRNVSYLNVPGTAGPSLLLPTHLPLIDQDGLLDVEDA